MQIICRNYESEKDDDRQIRTSKLLIRSQTLYALDYASLKLRADIDKELIVFANLSANCCFYP